MPLRRRRLLAGLVTLPALARAEAYPNRAVTMVVAFPPGGQGDVVARPVAAGLERFWRQPVPVVNRAGASGEVGYASVARAAPDGYSLLMGLSSLAVIPEAARLFGRAPAYEINQLTPVALFTADPTFLAVPAGSPWPDLNSFLADARARPGQIAYSSSGNYGALHLPMAMLTTAAGVQMLHVPFQGGGPAMTAILSGQVQALASGPGPLTPHMKSGALRVLASWGRRRIPGFEAVPTLLESGFPDAEFYIWAGIFVPADTPLPIVERLRESLAHTAAEPEVQRALAASGNGLDYREGASFQAFFKEDTARLVAAVARIGKVE